MNLLQMRLPAVLVVIVAGLMTTSNLVTGTPLPDTNNDDGAVVKPEVLPTVIESASSDKSDESPEDHHLMDDHQHHHQDNSPVAVEPIKADLQPVDVIKGDLQPVDVIKGDLQPMQFPGSESQATETREDEAGHKEASEILSVQIAEVIEDEKPKTQSMSPSVESKQSSLSQDTDLAGNSNEVPPAVLENVESKPFAVGAGENPEVEKDENPKLISVVPSSIVPETAQNALKHDPESNKNLQDVAAGVNFIPTVMTSDDSKPPVVKTGAIAMLPDELEAETQQEVESIDASEIEEPLTNDLSIDADAEVLSGSPPEEDRVVLEADPDAEIPDEETENDEVSDEEIEQNEFPDDGTEQDEITDEDTELDIPLEDNIPTPTISPTTPEESEQTFNIQSLDNSCTQPPLTGTCRGAFPMFYFDPNTRTCKQFVYGGCKGNKNIHKTVTECYQECYPQGLQSGNIPSVRSSQNDYLIIRDGTGASTLTFTGPNAAARIDPEVLKDFSITNFYAFDFHFRTDSPHGLIAFLRQVTVPGQIEGTRIQLYIYLSKGHLAITHVIGNMTESFFMEKGGLQAGNWHSAYVEIDAVNGVLAMDIDNVKEVFVIESLSEKHQYTGEQHSEGFNSVLWIGGVFEEELENEAMVHGFVPFHGCVQQMSLSSGKSLETMTRVQPFVAIQHNGVAEHCTNKCNNRYNNLCSPKSHCVEHFDHSTCNCFNSGQDGPRCNDPAIPVLSLNGDGYVVQRLYEWMDRVHSYTNLISLGFKTRFTDSILLYASAEYPERQYIAASITKAGKVYVEINLGGGAVSAEFGDKIDAEGWHTLIIVHQHEKIMIYLDSTLHASLIVPGNIRYFHLDPDVYVGNAPRLSRECGLSLNTGTENGTPENPCIEGGTHYYYDKHMGTCHSFHYTGCGGNPNRFSDEEACMDACYVPGLRSMNTFLGCMKTVFFNDISILQGLKEKSKTTRYYGSTKEAPLGTTCNDTKFLPVTFATERAAMNLINPQPNNFHLVISFKPIQPQGVLASGVANVTEFDTVSDWELRHDRNRVYFYLHDNLLTLKSDAKIKLNHWQYVEVRYTAGRLNLMVNNKKQGEQFLGKLIFSQDVTIGTGLLDDFPGFIGCIRKLEIGDTNLDLRTVVGTPMVNNDVTYDNCQVLGPCDGPRACEHGGQCSIDNNGEVECDCSDTGYSGKNCHFSLYKRSCEQYRQMGYNSSGIYRIDIDGNGPLQPAFVKCDFNPLLQETYTIIENNVETEYEVRRRGMKDFQLDVQYRDFTHEMLKYIISQSESCTQEVLYQCRRAPLYLSTRTWFTSPSERFISNFGTRTPGICRCSELKSCDNSNVPCNCDMNDGVPRRDKTIITNSDHLPLTSMVFLQGNDQREDSEAFITLGPLICVTQAVKEHTVSFTTSSSYLEVPAWREGSLIFTFRTTSQKAVVAYQPSSHPSHATFMISLVGDNEVEFMYRYRGVVHKKIIYTSQPLNDGQWQQIVVDVYNHQLRFVLNNEEEMIEVDPEVYLGVLDGSMYLGGLPEQLRKEEGNMEFGGLVGCIKGLTLNNEVVDLKKLIRTTAHGVSMGCNPSCEGNPCKNGGQCIEKWGSYECKCTNPFAHSGKNCEKNINEDAITFTTEESKYKHFTNATVERVGENILSESFLVNFRTYSSSGLILFAYNHLHNFVQLHLAEKNKVVFMFNHGSQAHKLEVTAEDDAFNNGQSVQVMVERSESSTVLNVFTEGNNFMASLDVGSLLLQENEYHQFPFGDGHPFPDLVYYPHSMTKPTPFFLLYLGDANDKRHDIKSEVPGISGCIRGLKVGAQVMSLPKMLSQSPYPTEGVVANCKMTCDRKPCRNGGRCKEDFQNLGSFQCDCTGTSYVGGTCKSETAYTFHGNEWVSMDSHISPLGSDFKFELAFSTSFRDSKSQLVSLLRSTNPSHLHDYLLISVTSDGSIEVEAQFQDLDPDMIHGASVTSNDDGISAFDGFRHYVVVEKIGGDWTVKIDGKLRQHSELRSVYIEQTQVKSKPAALFLGGIEEGLDDRLGHFDSFRGCISNVRIRTPEGAVIPLILYSEGDSTMKNRGLPGQGRCAPFVMAATTHEKLMTQGHEMNSSGVLGTDWVYNRPQKEPYHSPGPLRGEQERETVFDNVVPIVAGTVIAITILIVAFLLLRQHNKNKMRRQMQKNEEKKPLFNGRDARPSKDERTKNLYIVSKDEVIPLKSAPDGIELSSTGGQKTPIGFGNVPLADKEPSLEAQDVPEVIVVQVDDGTDDSTEKVEVHKEDIAAEGDVEVQVRSRKISEEGEVAGRPLSWDKSTDNLPLIIGQEGGGIVRSASGDDSSVSSLECTMELNSSPPGTPKTSAKPAPKDLESAAEESPSSTSERRSTLPYTDDKAKEDDTDAKPVLKSYKQFDEDGTEIKTDFSQVPTIKIERSDHEDSEVNVVDDEPEAEKADGEKSPPTTESEKSGTVDIEGESKDPISEDQKESEEMDSTANDKPEKEQQLSDESNDDFVESSVENTKVENAQRMSKTLEDKEDVSSTTTTTTIPDFNSMDAEEVEAVRQPVNQSSGVAGSIQTGSTDRALEERVVVDDRICSLEGVVSEIIGSKTEGIQDIKDDPNLELSENKNADTEGEENQGSAGPSDAIQRSEENSFSEDDSNFPDDLSVNSQNDSFRAEDLDEKDWSILSQWSERRRRSSSDEDQLRVSFTSEDGEGETNTYQSYINYGVDDDLLEDMTDPPRKPNLTHVQEETTTHLDTIQESDESEEDDDDDDTRNRITMPSQMKSTLSAGMFNLQDISSDGPEEIEDVTPESETNKEEKRINVDLGGPNTSSSSESQSSDEEKDANGSKDSDAENVRKTKKGRITDEKKVQPFYLSENVRTFSNPISYLGGPTIEYEETEGTATTTNDSLTSIASLD